MDDPEVTVLNATHQSNLIVRRTVPEAAGMAIRLVLRALAPLRSRAH